MERVLAPVFVVIVLCAGLSLDFYSQSRATPGLSVAEYAQKRLGAVTDRAAAVAEVVTGDAAVPGEVTAGGRAPSALTTLALAADTLALLSGGPASGGGDRTALPSPGTAFAQIAMAIAAGNRDAILPAAAMGGMAAGAADGATPVDPAAPPEEPVSLIQPVKPLTGSTCDTRAGTKFCSVGGG